MNIEAVLSALGVGGAMSGEFFLTQMGVLGVTAFAFAGSIVLCMLSFRAASSTQRALKTAEELAAEVRHLTAQIETASRRPARAEAETRDHAGESDPWTDNYGARAQSEASAISLEASDRAAPMLSDQALEAAKKAAIEPSALLRNRSRRR